MINNLTLKPEGKLDILEENTIQGLYSPNGACESFFCLLSKIVKLTFKEYIKENKKQ